MKRMTRQRQMIVNCLKEAKRPLSVEEILEAASKSIPHINLATVYRNLKMLIEEKQILAVDLAGNSKRYEFVGLEHHHHFLCLKCDRLFDVVGCPKGIDELIPPGFKMIGHNITLHGYCPGCQSL
jgi:Fur family ferric uptake transcriptional regulator